jgi:hypothetical protein
VRISMLIALGGGMLIVLSGCDEREERRTDPENDKVQLFEKGKGIRLPEQMRQTLGVETVEVVERAWPTRFEHPARVYRTGDATKPGAAVALLDVNEARELTLGQQVLLRDSISSGTEVAGRIVRREPQATVPGQTEALLEFPDTEGRFPAGFLLRAVFTVPQTNTVFVVPESAVLRGVEGAFVYALNGSYFTRTRVKLLGIDNGTVGIADGLYAGDVVAAKAADTLWMIELCALKGGTPCCPLPNKESRVRRRG